MAHDEDPKEEDDKVAAAYENISKKLDSLRSGKEPDDSEESKESKDEQDQDDVELAEWKGPKGVKEEEVEEDEEEIRRVKLKNLANEEDDSDESDESKDSEESDDDDDDEETEREMKAEKEDDEESDKGAKRRSDEDSSDDDDEPAGKKWEPSENDPLDEEDGKAEGSDESKESDDPEEVEGFEKSEKVADEEESNIELPERRPVENAFEAEESTAKTFESESETDFPQKRDPQPDTLDDLTEGAGAQTSRESEDDDYQIPHLKTSRHDGGDIGYNARSQSESFARDVSMDNMQNTPGGNDPNNFFSSHGQSQAPKRANKFHLLVLVIIGVAVIGFTVYILKGGFGQISMTSQPSPSPTPVQASPSATPTPTPEPQVDRGEFTVKVLNGTSTSGLAKTVNDKLEELGYETASPSNATNSAFTQTVVRVKSGSDGASLLQRLILDLAPDYSAVESTNLNDSASYDAEVILGEK